MSIGDLGDKARGALEGHEDQAQDALAKGGDAITDRTPDSIDDKVEMGVDKGDAFLENEKNT